MYAILLGERTHCRVKFVLLSLRNIVIFQNNYRDITIITNYQPLPYLILDIHTPCNSLETLMSVKWLHISFVIIVHKIILDVFNNHSD